ncbi:hypothetical protein BX616_005529, partial [Lobosporangium transversale]
TRTKICAMPSAGCFDTFRGLFSPGHINDVHNNNNGSSTSSIDGSSISGTSSGIQAPLAIVDMGSNGIRFGIIASMDRHLPVLYEERASISLYEAQFGNKDTEDLDFEPLAVAPPTNGTKDHQEGSSFDKSTAVKRSKEEREALARTLVETRDNEVMIKEDSGKPSERQPISEEVMDEVERTFKRWQALCHQANVETVRVIATEATRTAPNSEQFQKRIYNATGWTVQLLTKAQEANIGALGVIASYHTVKGLFMDLGGGSVQLNYIIRGPKDGHGESSPNAQSWPYGAAALSRRLNNCGKNQAARQAIYDEMVQAFKQGLEDINIAPEIKEDSEGGYRMYLSGGGFRALGYLLMARKVKDNKEDHANRRYPIPIINGYMASAKELAEIVEEYRYLDPDEVQKSFRVSKRRAKLIPACATLMAAAMKAIPIKEVLFSEGGVRQGGCFEVLPPEIQNKDPAFETVQSFVKTNGGQPPLHMPDVQALTSFVSSALPADFAECCRSASSFSSSSSGSDKHKGLPDKDAAGLQVFINSLERLVPLLVMVLNCYNQMPKEARSTAAWRLFLPGGALANCYGLTHSDRAILATVLAERHDGDLADPDTANVVKKLIPGGKVARQAAKYLGKILDLAGLCSPLPGIATLLLGGGGAPRHGGGILFEQVPEQSNGGRRNRRDNEKTRVEGEPSEDEQGPEDEEKVVVLAAGLLPSGGIAHGQVALRIDKTSKGHPLLMAPNVQAA